MKLYLHQGVTDATDEEIEGFRWRIERALLGGGPWVKSLSGGPWGPTRRVRVGRKRALFSCKFSEQEAVVWVHEIGWRREIYNRDTGIARARAWVEANTEDCLELLDYMEVERIPGSSTSDEDPGPLNLLPALSEEQAAFVRHVIPLEDDRRDRNTFVFMAKGPPGSGKTVVAADVARDAFLDSPNAQLGQRGADVLVLVPSGKLLRHYREELRPTAMTQAGSFARSPQSSEPRIWVERFIDFFGAFSSQSVTSRADVWTWWTKALMAPALRRWALSHPCVHEQRFADLLDACFGHEETPGGGAKDALSAFDRPLYDALGALRAGERDAIVHLKRIHNIRFRWEAAASATQAITAALPGRPLVIVVDEAQDMVPAEWQHLLDAAFQRHRTAVGQTVIALLGDENQRVAPTAFAWSDVNGFVRALHVDLESGAGCVMAELTGSFRIRREIARVANTLMEGRLVGDRARRAPVANPDDLERGGSVVVVRCADPSNEIVRAIQTFAGRVSEHDRLVHIGAAVKALAGLDTMDAREAKGLEFPTLVASSLLTGNLDWDTRSRAYVAITRAREKLAVVLTNDEWSKVADSWSGLVDLEDAAHLPAILEGLMLRVEGADRQNEQMVRIDNLVEQADEVDGNFPPEVLERAARLVEAGSVRPLVSHLDDVLRRRPNWEAALRSLAAEPRARTTQRIGAWLLLGDVGAACLVAEQAGASEAVTQTVSELASDEGPLTAASLQLRSAIGAKPDARLVDLMVTAFWAEVSKAFRASGAPKGAPRYVLQPQRRSEVMARTVLAAVDEQHDAAIRAVDDLGLRLANARQAISNEFHRNLLKRRAREALAKKLRSLDDLIARAKGEATSHG